MSTRIDFKKLKAFLKRMPNEKKQYDALFKEFISTKGEIYLYENVIKPFLRDEIPDAGELDLSAFTEEDLENVTAYFRDNVGECSLNHNAIMPFYRIFMTEEPQTASVAFL